MSTSKSKFVTLFAARAEVMMYDKDRILFKIAEREGLGIFLVESVILAENWSEIVRMAEVGPEI